MFIKMLNKDETIFIYSDIDNNSTIRIMQQSQWIVTHISSEDPALLYYDLSKAVPMLTVNIVDAILNVTSKVTEPIDRFIAVCNILARKGKPVFVKIPYETVSFQ